MAHDKKKKNQQLRFVLPKSLGDVDVHAVESKKIVAYRKFKPPFSFLAK